MINPRSLVTLGIGFSPRDMATLGYNITLITKNWIVPKIVYDLNFLSKTGFILEIDKIPNIVFFIQECNIPVDDLYHAEINTPLLDYSIPGNKLHMSSFSANFIIDENLENYNKILQWLYKINSPESLSNNDYFENLFSDGMLSILSNNNIGNVNIHFIDMFPIELSSVKFSANKNDVTYLECTIKFKFTYFKRI